MGEAVPTGESDKNFDFEISDGQSQVAVEITHYVEDPQKPSQDAKSGKFV
ncbi:MAG: hypothetical protein AAF219_04380 [Myxococcota bacterium]